VLTMNNVKILHAVRSAITAIAELLVNSVANVPADSVKSRMLGGRLFQIRGPATANDLSPTAVQSIDPSVRPSVRLSVTLVDQDHTNWNS